MCKYIFFICLTLKLISNIASNRFIFHKESNILIPTILLFPFIKAAAIAQVFDQLGDIFAGTEYNRDYMKMKSEINLDDEPVKHKEKLAEHTDKESTSKSKDKTQNSLLDSSADGVANDLVSMDGSAIDLDNVASKVQNLKVMVPKTDDITFSSFQPFTVSKVTDCGVMTNDSIKSFVTKTLEPKLVIPPDDGCTNGINNLNMQNLPYDCCSNLDGDVLISCLANCLCDNSPNQSPLPLFQQNTPLQNECKPNANITCNQNQYNRNVNTPAANNQLQISNINNRLSNYPSTGQGRNNIQRVPKQIPNSLGNVLTRFNTSTKSSLVTNTILKYITSTFNVYNRMPVKTRTSYSYIVSTYSRIITQPVYSTVTQPIYSTFTQPVYSTIIQPVYSTITQPIYSTVVQPVTYTSTLPVNHVRTITKPVNVVKTVTTPVYYQQILTVPSNDNLEIKRLLHDLQNRLKPMATLSAQNLEIQRLNNKLHSVYEMIRNGSVTKNYASECNGKQCMDKPKTVVESRPCEGKMCSSACTSTKSSSNKTRTIMAKTCYGKRCNECPNSECNNCESTSCQSCQMSSTEPSVCTSKTGDKCPTSDVTITIGPAQSIESNSTDRTKSKTHSILTESAISKSKSESDMTNNINTTICVTDKDNNISCTVINSNTDYPKPSSSIPSHTSPSKTISSDKADKTFAANDSNTNKRTSTYYHTNTKVEKNTCDCPQTSSKECPLDMQCDKYKTSKHHTCSSDKISTVSATCENEPDVADAYVEDNGDVRYVLLSDILSEMDV